MTARPLRRGAAGAVVATVLLATPAFAHPFFDPDEVPVDSLAPITLEIAHGCDVEDHDGDGEADTGDEAPTREVAVEVPDAALYVEPADTDGWDLDVETDGEAEVIVYRAQEGTDEPAPSFDLDVVLTGEAGDEVYWRVVQACDDTTYRWVGTPDEPAEDPAVAVVLAGPDEDAPPPEEAGTTDRVTVVDEAEVEEETTDEAGGQETTAPEDEPIEDAEDLEPADEDAGMPGWILIAVLVVTLVIAGVVLSLKSRDDDAQGSEPGTGAGNR